MRKETSAPADCDQKADGRFDVSWVEHLSRNSRRKVRLFCFPFAGGSAHMFRHWQGILPEQIDLCLVHLPGRRHLATERPFTRLDLLVDAIAQAIVPEVFRPFAFYGHSMGALIAYELARTLRVRYDCEPTQLFLSGRRAAQLSHVGRRTYDLPDSEFLKEIESLNGTPRDLLDDPEARKLFLPLLRADFELAETYNYKPSAPLSCPMIVYGGVDDPQVSEADLAVWRQQTTGEFLLRVLPGDHFFIRSNERAFMNVFGRDLARASGSNPSFG
jgi:surfactin synthase thioesterase subunit